MPSLIVFLDLRFLLLIGKCLSNLTLFQRLTCVFVLSEVISGMDASQMDESLYEAQWEGEADYHPFEGSVRLE